MANEPTGEAHPHHRLTWAQVAAIRADRDTPDVQLAARFGVSKTSIRRIRQNETWIDPGFVPRRSPRSPLALRFRPVGENAGGEPGGRDGGGAGDGGRGGWQSGGAGRRGVRDGAAGAVDAGAGAAAGSTRTG